MQIIDSEKIPIKLWLDDIEEEALKQARNLANLPGAFHHIAIMPDAHVGFGMPIGGVLATEGAVVPNAVGVDIGCGMIAVRTETDISRKSLEKIVAQAKQAIPTGFKHHKKPQHWDGFDRAPQIPVIERELASARKQIGTLGGGNHFLEILEEVSDNRYGLEGKGGFWLMVHSGSRNFGLKVASAYHKQAQEQSGQKGMNLPSPDLAFLDLDSKQGQEYWQAMEYCQEFAQANRELMMRRFMEVASDIAGCGFCDISRKYGEKVGQGAGILDPAKHIWIHHNYAAREEHFGRQVVVHRKGATRAFAGQVGIVPGSMGSPAFIVQGTGEPESFKSCAHGAGRVMGRKEAKRKLSPEEANEAIAGLVFSGWQGKYDEAPQVYKDIEQVIAGQLDLAKPVVKLWPRAVVIG